MSSPAAIPPAPTWCGSADSFFINSATIGVPARIAEDIPHGLKKWFGRIGYLGYGVFKFLKMTPFTAHISQPGLPDIVEQVLEIRIGNGPFIGGLRVMDKADPESRDIVVQLVLGRYTASLAGVWRRTWPAGDRPAAESMKSARPTLPCRADPSSPSRSMAKPAPARLLS